MMKLDLEIFACKMADVLIILHCQNFALGRIWPKPRMVWHRVSIPTLLPNCAVTLKSSVAKRWAISFFALISWIIAWYKVDHVYSITSPQFHSELNFGVHFFFDWFWNWTGLLGFGQNTCHQAVWSYQLSTRNCQWVDPPSLGISSFCWGIRGRHFFIRGVVFSHDLTFQVVWSLSLKMWTSTFPCCKEAP